MPPSRDVLPLPLLAMDVEGTLTDPQVETPQGNVSRSAWTRLSMALGEACHRDELASHERWTNGEYPSYVDWMKDTLIFLREHGLCESVYRQVIDGIPLHRGVAETLQWARDRFHLVFISGGFKQLTDRVQQIVGAPSIAYSACDFSSWNPDGTLRAANLLPCDYQEKPAFMRVTQRHLHIPDYGIVAIGDGPSDKEMVEEVEMSVAFNGPKLAPYTTHVITQEKGKEDFADVIPFLETFLERYRETAGR